MTKSVYAQKPLQHRFQVGEQVKLSRGFGYSRKTGVVYDIVALLPSDRSHFQYRIRSKTEAFERVAAENELVSRSSLPDASHEGERHGQGPATQQ